jgi:hypothetical protein
MMAGLCYISSYPRNKEVPVALTGTISSKRARQIDNAERLKRTRERNLIEYGRKSGPTRAQVTRALHRYLTSVHAHTPTQDEISMADWLKARGR